MKTLPLALLVFRGGCPVTEAYLAYLRLHGLRPALIMAIDYVGDGYLARKLSQLLGARLAARLLRFKRNRAARVTAQLAATLQQGWPVQLSPGHEPNYEAEAQSVLHLTVKNFADPRLLEAMRGCGVRTFLYCSGGRVPAEMFRQDFRILHIHPGVVPHVRGSDGLLWSLLARGCPGASCFFMDAGIDTGRVIGTAEYETPHWAGLRVEPVELYHALLQCYDPHLRASLLLSILLESPGLDIAALEASIQPQGGTHYYSMHPEMRARVLSRLCA